MLNSQAAELLTMLAGAPPLASTPIEARRQAATRAVSLTGDVTELAAVDDVLVDTVPVRVYRPSVSPGLPVVAFAHGGGWSIGNLDTHDRMARDLAARSGAVVVAIDFRLAPEHPFPAGLDDCVGVLRRLLQDGAGLAVDPARVAVCGESSGANLLAAACQSLRGTGIVHQVLIYPVLDLAGVGATESYRAFGESGYFHSTEDIAHIVRDYAGTADVRDPRLSPARAADLSGLPPATILTAELDPVRDEAEAYAGRLGDAGVPVELRRFDGQIHAFVSFAGVLEDGVRGRAWIADRIRQALF
ncbi:alpha/beta hydrolase [Actinoplanes sp. TBRC 11911]|uniref:alpha/beta hydrolase n=1 Tax=Actinoplanes sp. TBRC 11911 TaxID=2729386 RepID=UPI00145CE177|nr:alpha/beta hydrolase [Actinoplanes sp. TBRC 11911]NMO49911.1 alpha/beta hydrolase [Actinoplanes sp. TBRC 11911]